MKKEQIVFGFLFCLLLVTSFILGFVLRGLARTETQDGKEYTKKYFRDRVKTTPKSSPPALSSGEDKRRKWKWYEGKYVRFQHPSWWRVELFEDQQYFPIILGCNDCKVRGFSGLIISNEKRIWIIKFHLLSEVGGYCSTFYLFPDSKENCNDLINSAIEEGVAFNPTVRFLTKYQKDFVFLDHRIRWVEDMIFIDRDNTDGDYFDSDCWGSVIDYSKDGLFVFYESKPNDGKLERHGEYLLDINFDDASREDLSRAKLILESFKVINQPTFY